MIMHDELALTDGPVRIVAPTSMSLDELVRAKAGRRLSVCLPARNEAATVGPIVESIVGSLMTAEAPFVDELLVLDDGSTDDTAQVAEAAGAVVHSVSSILPDEPPGTGKGKVLWKSIAASTGDLIVWCDTDLVSFTPAYVSRLVAPLLEDPELALVKGYYERPIDGSGQGGGRTTELVARPLLSLFFPPLATIKQPLGGECAATRELLEQLPFVESYGVESALLIDTLRLRGTRCMAQVDLGIRLHRHRSLTALSEQASEILSVVLGRAGMRLPDPLPPLLNALGERRPVHLVERPPMVSIAAYRDRA